MSPETRTAVAFQTFHRCKDRVATNRFNDTVAEGRDSHPLGRAPSDGDRAAHCRRKVAAQAWA
jgi:hypothetical protein